PQIRSLIAIPLHDGQDRAIGALYLDRRDPSTDQFTESDLQRLEHIAAILTSVLMRQKELEQARIQADIRNLGLFIGNSPKMHAVYQAIRQAAEVDLPIYIEGETGTGKELVAEALHRLSPRKEKPFIAINCAAIPADLAEDELFGHEKGAFTDASGQTLGKFELANEGTLFLDEIADLPLGIQGKLLRVLEQYQIWRVGGQKPVKLNVRLIAATSQSLKDRVLNHQFRDDLFHRLNVLKISLPPLRERSEDIPLLTNHFLEKYAASVNKKIFGLTHKALSLLQTQTWSGNVRELENIIAKVVVNHKDDLPITIEDLHRAGLSRRVSTQTALPKPAPGQFDPWSIQLLQSLLDEPTLDGKLAILERTVVAQNLAANKGNISRSARELQTNTKRLHRILKRHGIQQRS
ncbi:MAG: sigma-54-dependent Fis family transcriptional regulator, partial [Planctomycetes bacterium]|nr:sigma-54-dependent Fis family transcriptional regulator [Planctomycetota bacterium]